jgi:lysophospholipase L1-like esterase
VFKIRIFIVVLFCSLNLQAKSGFSVTDSLIAISQTGAMPLTFSPFQYGLSKITVAECNEAKETTVRNGLPTLFSKIALNRGTIKIGFIGGSITRANNQYRGQTLDYLQRTFPKVTFSGINAGVSGTGTDLGDCRLNEHILKYNPDLVFVEFAVNGGPDEAMEGIIRQVKRHNPHTDICLIYTITQTKSYAAGEIPVNIDRLEKIADHYNLPSIHLGLQVALLEKAGKLLWKADATVLTDKIIFSNDGVHPTEAGGNIYASAIARAMEKMKNSTESNPQKLPIQIFADNWEDAKMLDPLDAAKFSKGWKILNPKDYDDFKQFAPWFPYLLKAENTGETFTFKFKGKAFGIFDIGGPEVGQLEILVDGKNVQLSKTSSARIQQAEYVENTQPALLNRFNSFCNNRYRGQFDMVELEAGVHTVKMTVSKQKANKSIILGNKNQSDIIAFPEKYQQNWIYLGKILIRGEIMK